MPSGHHAIPSRGILAERRRRPKQQHGRQSIVRVTKKRGESRSRADLYMNTSMAYVTRRTFCPPDLLKTLVEARTRSAKFLASVIEWKCWGLCRWVVGAGYSLVTVTENRTKTGAHCKSRNSRVNLAEPTIYAPKPGWRNWQTQRTQNPPVLGTLGVRLPLPAPVLLSARNIRCHTGRRDAPLQLLGQKTSG